MKISVVVCFTSFYTLLLVGFLMDTFLRTNMAVKKHMVPWPLFIYVAAGMGFIYNNVSISFR